MLNTLKNIKSTFSIYYGNTVSGENRVFSAMKEFFRNEGFLGVKGIGSLCPAECTAISFESSEDGGYRWVESTGWCLKDDQDRIWVIDECGEQWICIDPLQKVITISVSGHGNGGYGMSDTLTCFGRFLGQGFRDFLPPQVGAEDMP